MSGDSWLAVSEADGLSQQRKSGFWHSEKVYRPTLGFVWPI
jgi:hypothetical protein